MKKLLIIMGSPRQDGICQELINQVRKYFLDCEIKLYDSYKLAPSPSPIANGANITTGALIKIWIYFLRILRMPIT